MAIEKPIALSASRLPVFAIACWALALMAMSQLLVAGLALATRFEESREVRVVIKEVPKLIAVRVPSGAADTEQAAAVVSRPPLPPPAAPVESRPLPPPTPVTVPQVGDPRSERMVNEARQARVAGDMGLAIVKLEEALSQSAGDPNVHYELGLVHEQMGVFDVAAAHYEKVFQMGVSGAGKLYELAAAKLRDGFAEPDAMVGKLALGRVRIFNDPTDEQGQRVVLTIPVQKAPTDEIDVADIAVSVTFFNRTSKGEIVQLEDKSWVTEQWVSLPFDWTGGEENLRMTYVIPSQDGQTEHLFGSRSYYGQVVSLLYQGEILDVQAWPRDLAARIPRSASAGHGDPVLPEFQDTLPPGFDPSLPLLPPLPSK
ncbi:MAG: tetratricopeptide repeat protein [Luteolibacter sp.]